MYFWIRLDFGFPVSQENTYRDYLNTGIPFWKMRFLGTVHWEEGGIGAWNLVETWIWRPPGHDSHFAFKTNWWRQILQNQSTLQMDWWMDLRSLRTTLKKPNQRGGSDCLGIWMATNLNSRFTIRWIFCIFQAQNKRELFPSRAHCLFDNTCLLSWNYAPK